MKRKRKLWYTLSCEDHWCLKRKWYKHDAMPIVKPGSTFSSTKSFYNKNKALRAFRELVSEGKNPLLAQFKITDKGHLLLNTWEKENVK